jgi:sugar phosphate isomerase/epimerase
MANQPFIVDNTIPGLGASDLARLMGAGYVVGFGGLKSPGGQTRPKARRSLLGLLRKLAEFRRSAR